MDVEYYKELEEIRVLKNLGFNFNQKGNYKEHIKELQTKGKAAAKKTWSLG